MINITSTRLSIDLLEFINRNSTIINLLSPLVSRLVRDCIAFQIRIRKDKESQSFYGEIGASFSRSIYVIINHTKGFVR
ncbi:hypothetical protein MHTCC0001_35580 [Flavobacteriaceae bacterium MHTCC 0001]